MKKLVTALVVVAGLALAPSAMAEGNGPGGNNSCKNHPDKPYCGGDGNVTVEPATPQECPTGGVVVIVNDVRYKVCNGANGQTGAPGTPGTDGAAGATGQTGATGATGANGAAGANGTNGTNGTDGANGTNGQSVAAKCVSNGAAFRFTVPKRFSGKVKVKLAGKTVTVKVPKNRKISVKRKGLRCGAYAVLVTKRGVRPYVRLFTATPSGNLDGVQHGLIR